MVSHISISEKNVAASQREVVESGGEENASEGEEFQKDQVNDFVVKNKSEFVQIQRKFSKKELLDQLVQFKEYLDAAIYFKNVIG
ncbi:hypothetical protein TTHERM_00185170 (macronuclear) [Tetrahymena thermophila SB210]|uniref:Uncharacterized protein n=1 Tax=Tetrahymena thermophila (strain SB210) TaxID=312017 RepID=Q22T95_TETTS|nr:hypothetical protein TTHERM_00185170 [Tetrahymena thermophila SB210]EAR88543.2 hypothetical protein TTHERM_00185170 [Tetrahymena thermophila SB210]|eukprot:XP_001008788.2 hypothetical protein TTHERM_00185170 [Tetrahymena thermophila SB210]